MRFIERYRQRLVDLLNNKSQEATDNSHLHESTAAEVYALTADLIREPLETARELGGLVGYMIKEGARTAYHSLRKRII